MFKGLHCQSATSRVFDDKGVFLESVKPPAALAGRVRAYAMRCERSPAPMSPRRFPPPWSAEEQAARFVVRDHDG
jgi:hypothetical protein